jgi:DNA-binding protein HU-beta
VDALTANVTDAFQKDIQNSDLWERYSKATNHQARKSYIKNGNQRFMQILNDFNRTRDAKTKIPAALDGMAELRGELVLFKNPPIYENHPQASFRGIRRIDSNLLIEQIADQVSIPKIPYYTSDDATQRDMLITEISREFRINQAASARYFNKLIEIFTNKLQQGNKINLPNFGSFKVIHMKARKGRNPQTQEEIDIPARNKVKFSPAKKLKSTVN